MALYILPSGVYSEPTIDLYLLLGKTSPVHMLTAGYTSSCLAEDLAPYLHKPQNTEAVNLQRFSRHCHHSEAVSSIIYTDVPCAAHSASPLHRWAEKQPQQRSSGSLSPVHSGAVRGSEGR